MSRKMALKWVKEAENDFEMAEILLNSNKFNGSVFHSQQAAEKVVKALLYHLNLQPWGHSIIRLLETYENDSDVEIEEKLRSIARRLDRHYTSSRYPDVLPNWGKVMKLFIFVKLN